MSVGLLDFFVLEASDYVDRLQRLVAADEPQGPDAATLLKLARGLRGSAVMARLNSFAEATSGVERAARLLQEGRIAWTPGLGVSVADAISELRALIPMARLWGESHDQRARSAAGKLTTVLDAVEHHGEAMQRDGVAPPLANASSGAPNAAVTAFFDSIDHGAKAPAVPPQMSSPLPPMPVTLRSLESASVPTPSAGMVTMSDAQMPIVPIASLAPSADADSVVYRAPNPTISFAQRFIADVTPLVGSLRARLAPLRQGAMQEASSDMVASFRPVLVSLRDIAASYQHEDIRTFVDAVLTAQAPLPAAASGALDSALTVILQQDLAGHVRAQRLAELRRVVLAATPLSTTTQAEPASRSTGMFTPRRTPIVATATPTPAPVPTVSRATPSAPSGRELASLLNSSLQRTRELETTPLDLIAVDDNGAAPSVAGPDGEPDVVTIDSLLYRGPRALSRARHLVAQLRGNGASHDEAVLHELFDLVDLAGSAN
jgi:chemotaxis protein histidine kinase CheA